MIEIRATYAGQERVEKFDDKIEALRCMKKHNEQIAIHLQSIAAKYEVEARKLETDIWSRLGENGYGYCAECSKPIKFKAGTDLCQGCFTLREQAW